MTESLKAALRRSNELKQGPQSAPGARLKGRSSEKLNKALLVWSIHFLALQISG